MSNFLSSLKSFSYKAYHVLQGYACIFCRLQAWVADLGLGPQWVASARSLDHWEQRSSGQTLRPDGYCGNLLWLWAHCCFEHRWAGTCEATEKVFSVVRCEMQSEICFSIFCLFSIFFLSFISCLALFWFLISCDSPKIAIYGGMPFLALKFCERFLRQNLITRGFWVSLENDWTTVVDCKKLNLAEVLDYINVRDWIFK